jgi:hypothetical protein
MIQENYNGYTIIVTDNDSIGVEITDKDDVLVDCYGLNNTTSQPFQSTEEALVDAKNYIDNGWIS